MQYVLLFVFGACVGSFVNVVTIRYNTGLSFLRGESVCLSCSKKLEWYELLPIISYLFLKGRCKGCSSKFSIQYLFVEIFFGLAFTWIFLNHSIIQSLLLSIIFCLLSIIFLYDLKHKIIPDSFVILFILFSFLYSYLGSSIQLLASIVIPLPFFLIWLLSKGRMMGLGDAKFMVGMGLLLGLERGISAVFLSFWLGGIFVLILYLLNKLFSKSYNTSMKSELAFAPFLVLGTLITFIFQINFLNLS